MIDAEDYDIVALAATSGAFIREKAVLFHATPQSGSVDPECPGCVSAVPAVGLQRFLEGGSLDGLADAGTGCFRHRLAALRIQKIGGQKLHVELLSPGQNDGMLDDVLEFPDVSRVITVLKKAHEPHGWLRPDAARARRFNRTTWWSLTQEKTVHPNKCT